MFYTYHLHKCLLKNKNFVMNFEMENIIVDIYSRFMAVHFLNKSEQN